MYTYQILLLIIMMIVIGLLITKQMVSYKIASSLSAVLISSLIYYCVIPLLIFIFPKDVDHGTYVSRILNSELNHFLNGWFCVLLFLYAVSVSYNFSSCTRGAKTFSCVFGTRYHLLICKFLLFCSIVGCSCFFFYILSFGGIVSMLENSELVRSFSGEADIPYYSKLLVFPARLVVLVPCFMIMYIETCRKKKLLLKFLFLLSFMLGLLFYVNNAGKTGIVIYLIALIVPIIYRFSNNAWKIVLLFGIVSISLVGYLDNLFLFFTTGTFYDVEGSSLIDNISQFAYPSSNIMSLDGITRISGYRCGMDFISGVFNQIPGINLPLSFEYTSQFHSGPYWKDGGGTPTDSVTFGYMQFGYFGVLLWGTIIGFLSGWFDSRIKKIDNSFGVEYFKSTVIVAFFVMTTNADIYIILRSQFTLWIPLLFLWFLCKKRKQLIY